MENITIKVRYFAILREQSGLSEESIKTTACTAGQLYKNLKERFNFSLEAELIKVAINQKFQSLDTVLQQNDELVFIPPVAGG